MKRITELHKLSADHHLGLVIARRAKLAVEGKEGYKVPGIWEEIERKFPVELEPHFRIEEDYLVPAMELAGEEAMVARLKKDHVALRAAMNPGEERTAEALKAFAERLEKHIRFEERELFEVAQERLGSDVFEAIENACKENEEK